MLARKTLTAAALSAALCAACLVGCGSSSAASSSSAAATGASGSAASASASVGNTSIGEDGWDSVEARSLAAAELPEAAKAAFATYTQARGEAGVEPVAFLASQQIDGVVRYEYLCRISAAECTADQLFGLMILDDNGTSVECSFTASLPYASYAEGSALAPISQDSGEYAWSLYTEGASAEISEAAQKAFDLMAKDKPESNYAPIAFLGQKISEENPSQLTYAFLARSDEATSAGQLVVAYVDAHGQDRASLAFEVALPLGNIAELAY